MESIAPQETMSGGGGLRDWWNGKPDPEPESESEPEPEPETEPIKYVVLDRKSVV